MADILFFAFIAAVIVWRLRQVLGTEVDVERDAPLPPREQPVPVPAPVTDIKTARARKTAENLPAELVKPVADARKVDPDFDPDDFLEGAKAAFEMIFDAYQQGDADTLRDLTSPALFKEFEHSIEARKSADRREENTLIALTSAAIESMKVRAGKATIAVRFVSEQVSLVRDREGAVIEGNSRHVEEMEERWTFERDLRSADPTWTLVDIEALEIAA